MISKIVTFSVLLVASVSFSEAQVPKGTWQDGYNLFWAKHCEYTNQYATHYVKSWQQCGPICKNDKRCSFFTWSRAFGGECRLFQAGPIDQLSARPSYGKICGYVRHDAPTTDENIFWNDAYYYFWAQNCRLNLFDITKERADSGKECARKCFRNNDCKFYTWVKHDRACYFKSIPDYDTKFDPSFADPRTDLECGFLKPNVHGPSIPENRWNDNQVGFWSDDCSFDGRHVRTRRAISFWDCAHECTYYSSCTFYTWIPANSGTCILKWRDGFNPASVKKTRGDRCGFIKGV